MIQRADKPCTFQVDYEKLNSDEFLLLIKHVAARVFWKVDHVTVSRFMLLVPKSMNHSIIQRYGSVPEMFASLKSIFHVEEGKELYNDNVIYCVDASLVESPRAGSTRETFL